MPEAQWTITTLRQSDRLDAVIDAFLVDRKVQNVTPGTMYFYQKKLLLLQKYCDAQQVKLIAQIDSIFLRLFLLKLSEDHNPGGVHAVYRAVRSLLLWYQGEFEPDGWTNPIKKVKPPRLDNTPLIPVSPRDFDALIKVSNTRDKAIFLFLLDTGVRASELLAIILADVNLLTGDVLIRRGKGGKPRRVYMGRKTKRAVREYIKRWNITDRLWLTDDGYPLTYWGLRSMVARRSRQAMIEPPELHAFRRSFALNMLRNGCDVFSLQRLMGHADLQVLRRYLAQTDQDIQASPSVVDNL